MVLDGPAHYALSVITLIAISGRTRSRTVDEIAGELEIPVPRVRRALRDLAAGRLLELDLAEGRIGYRTARSPSDITIAEIIEAALPACRRRSPDAPPAARARRSVLDALHRVTLNEVLSGYARRVG